MKTAAIYARVSADQQRQEKTIASQTAALIAFARNEGYSVPAEWIFQDEGNSGASLVRPGLERVRDLAAEGQIQAVLALSPDRLSRKYVYQVLLIEELGRHGVVCGKPHVWWCGRTDGRNPFSSTNHNDASPQSPSNTGFCLFANA
jgi:site-specific DNA recombinase